MFQYIHHSCQANFQNFKYSGGTDSITYKHIWSPFAEYLLKFTPSHVAPNLITLTSLILLSFTHICYMFIGDNSARPASWKLVLMAVSIFIYQNLDNLDGKQARKTGSSSPLGMLFDHGTDAVSSFLIAIQVIQFLEVKNQNISIFVLFLFVMVIYFCAMWSQYSTGMFKLGQINPVDQGLPGYTLAAIACIFLPDGFWNTETFIGPYNYILIYSLAILVVLIIYFMIRDNFTKSIRSKQDVLNVLLLPLSYLLVLVSIYWFKPQVFTKAYLPFIYVLMFTWSRNMIEIQVYFVTKQKYNPFNFGSLAFIISSVLYLFLDVNAHTYYWIVVGISAIIFFEFVVSVLLQGSGLLGIRVFSLQKGNKRLAKDS